MKPLSFLNTDQEKRDIIAAGTAAGIGSAFGAPIGGVLFTLEETSSFWDSAMTLRVVFCSLMATFFFNVMVAHDDLDSQVLVALGKFDNFSVQLVEVPIFIIIGILGGVLGAAFVKLHLRIEIFRRRFITPKSYLRVLEAISISIFMAVGHFLLLYFDPSCHPHSEHLLGEGMKLFCPEGQFSSASYITVGTAEHGLKQLLHGDPGSFPYPILTAYTIFWFFTTCWATGLICPGGILIPGLLIGAGWGRMIGRVVIAIFPQHVSFSIL